MKKFHVEVTEKALEDVENIFLYISVDLQAPENAAGQYDRIVQSIMNLERMPERYPVIESEPECSRGMRLMPVDNYSVIYFIRESRVIVTNVLYSASDLHERLR